MKRREGGGKEGGKDGGEQGKESFYCMQYVHMGHAQSTCTLNFERTCA